MKPASFDYFRADSIEAALRQLSAGGGQARLIAGGQSLGPMLNMRLATPAELIDLNDLTELAYIRDAGDCLEVGALTRHEQMARSPLVWRNCALLAQAARTIGHYAIRQRGTLGGSLANADPAAQLPLVTVTLRASIQVISTRGERSVPADKFFVAAMTTALAPDEIIRCVRFPKTTAEGSAFQMFNRRHGDFAIVTAAVSLAMEGDRIAKVRLGVGGAEAVPRQADDLVPDWIGQKPQADWAEVAAQSVAAALEPEESSRIPAPYRKELACTLVRQALECARMNAMNSTMQGQT